MVYMPIRSSKNSTPVTVPGLLTWGCMAAAPGAADAGAASASSSPEAGALVAGAWEAAAPSPAAGTVLPAGGANRLSAGALPVAAAAAELASGVGAKLKPATHAQHTLVSGAECVLMPSSQWWMHEGVSESAACMSPCSKHLARWRQQASVRPLLRLCRRWLQRPARRTASALASSRRPAPAQLNVRQELQANEAVLRPMDISINILVYADTCARPQLQPMCDRVRTPTCRRCRSSRRQGAAEGKQLVGCGLGRGCGSDRGSGGRSRCCWGTEQWCSRRACKEVL